MSGKQELKAKLTEKLNKGGAISSDDIASFAVPDKKAKEPVGDVTVPEAAEAKKDPVMNVANLGDAADGLNKRVDSSAAGTKLTQDIVNIASDPALASFVPVTITPADRESFIDALITNTRFCVPFELFDGRVRGIIRSRKQSETLAIIARINYELTALKQNESPVEYAARLRNMLLAAQIAEFNGTKMAELKTPYMRTVNGKDDVQEPGWLSQVDYWLDQHDGLTIAIYTELQKFERKYWTMVKEATNQNFLNPAESTLA